MSLSQILTPLELAGVSTESRTKLEEALIEAYVQGANAECPRMGGLSPMAEQCVRRDARELFQRGQLGIPASRWFGGASNARVGGV